MKEQSDIMMKFKNIKISIVLALVIISLLLPWMTCLTISSSGNTQQLVAINGIKKFEYQYIHSVTDTLVREVYLIQGKQLILSQIVYNDHGAGLPDLVSRSEDFRQEGEAFVLNLKSEPVDSLNFMVISKYNNQIIVKNQLLSLFPGGETSEIIKIEIKQLTIIQWLIHKLT